MKRARLVVLTGCSASGKTTLMELLAQCVPGLSMIPTTTSRPPRPGDPAGDYRHVGHDEFQQKAACGEIVLVAYKNGYGYGIDSEDLRCALARDGMSVRSTTPDCVAEFHRLAGKDAIFVHIEAPAPEICRQRMRQRGGMSADEIEARLAEEAGWDETMADMAGKGLPVLVLRQCETPRQLLEQALELLSL